MEEIQERVLDLTRAISQLHRRQVTIENAIEILGEQGFDDVSPGLVKELYDHLSLELQKYMKRCHDKADKSLYYCVDSENDNFCSIWSERYVVVSDYRSPNQDFHTIEVFDPFNDKSMQVTVETSGTELWSIYPLDENFGLLWEYGNYTHFVSLIFLDFHRRKLEKLDTIQRRFDVFSIIVNKDEPTQFVLKIDIEDGYIVELFTIVGTSIVAGDSIQISFEPDGYFDERLYGLKWIENDDENTAARIFTYDLQQRNASHFDLDLPEGYEPNFSCVEFIGDRVFTSLRGLNNYDVLACIDLQTRQWSIVDFSPQFGYDNISLFYEKQLVIKTEHYDKGLNKHRFYKLSVGKPDRLQNLAWFVLVGYMKRINHPKGAYEAARRFLPYNSAIRCPFAQPEPDEKKGPRDKFIKMG